jgi:hypothetical protein
MKAEEESCTVDRQLVSLGAKPVYGALLWTDSKEIIADELEYILSGACRVGGDVS